MKIIFKEKTTGKIAAVFEGCNTLSERYNNTDIYAKDSVEGAVSIDVSLIPPTPQHETLEQKIKRIVKLELEAKA
jgi:hypothetical protein